MFQGSILGVLNLLFTPAPDPDKGIRGIPPIDTDLI